MMLTGAQTMMRRLMGSMRISLMTAAEVRWFNSDQCGCQVICFLSYHYGALRIVQSNGHMEQSIHAFENCAATYSELQN